MQAQVAELKDVKGDAVKFEACAKAAHELLAEGEKLKVKMEAEMEALKVGVLVDCGQLWAVFGVSRLEVWVVECMGSRLKWVWAAVGGLRAVRAANGGRSSCGVL